MGQIEQRLNMPPGDAARVDSGRLERLPGDAAGDDRIELPKLRTGKLEFAIRILTQVPIAPAVGKRLQVGGILPQQLGGSGDVARRLRVELLLQDREDRVA